jgi:hypothetical protein
MTDLGEYCRRVEQHLTQVNGGHLVRVVGPGFEMVRQWAEDGIPLTVVFRGIELKAERHRAGASRRPLRIEFCDADVRETFDAWRRAIGMAGPAPAAAADTPPGAAPAEAEDERPRASLSKHLARAIDRLSRAAGRLDLPDALRDVIGATLSELTALRDAARTARGPARDDLSTRLTAIDRIFAANARAAVASDIMEALRLAAELDLAPYRSRLSPLAWTEAVNTTVDRLLRDRFGLPSIGD